MCSAPFNSLFLSFMLSRLCIMGFNVLLWHVQENYEFLSRCIKEDIGFKDTKPSAACIIYKCLLQWHAFESDRTVIFDHIIEGINDVLRVSVYLCLSFGCFVIPKIHNVGGLQFFLWLLSEKKRESGSGKAIFDQCDVYISLKKFRTWIVCNCFRLGMRTLPCHIGCPMHQHFSVSCRGIYGQMVSQQLSVQLGLPV